MPSRSTFMFGPPASACALCHTGHPATCSTFAASTAVSSWGGDGPDRSTSELTVYLHVHRLTSGLKCNTARVMAVTGQEADERVGEECAPNPFLPFVVTMNEAALYPQLFAITPRPSAGWSL